MENLNKAAELILHHKCILTFPVYIIIIQYLICIKSSIYLKINLGIVKVLIVYWNKRLISNVVMLSYFQPSFIEYFQILHYFLK